jgi:hypothetical protein
MCESIKNNNDIKQITKEVENNFWHNFCDEAEVCVRIGESSVTILERRLVTCLSQPTTSQRTAPVPAVKSVN